MKSCFDEKSIKKGETPKEFNEIVQGSNWELRLYF